VNTSLTIIPGKETPDMKTLPQPASVLRRSFPAAALVALAVFVALTGALSARVARAETANRSVYGIALEGPGRSVVAVRYQLRPKERPKGGEGPKVRKITAGVAAGPKGQVIINASSFPEADAGPDSVEPFDFRIVPEDGVEVAAEVVGLDRDRNLAFIRATNPAALLVPQVAFETAPPLAIGDEVVVIGLLAEPYGFRHAAYLTRLNGRAPGLRAMYSIDTTLPDLCGGGLVVRPDGKAVGFLGLDLLPEAWENAEPGNLLSLFGSANQGQRPGYQMVYPASTFASLLATPPPVDDEDKDKKGWLGITMQPLSRDLAEYWNIDAPGGVILDAVLEGSPAAAAGLKAGDVVLTVDGEPLPVREQKDLSVVQKMIRRAGAGRDIPLSIWRGGEQRTVSVKLVASPTTAVTAEEYENDDFGVTVRQLTYDVVQSLNLASDTHGVIVSKTERAGWAQVAGLDRGDIVQKVDGAPIDGLPTFKAALEKARKERRAESSMLVLRNYKTRFVRLQTSWK
jgi:serine protease Do